MLCSTVGLASLLVVGQCAVGEVYSLDSVVNDVTREVCARHRDLRNDDVADAARTLVESLSAVRSTSQEDDADVVAAVVEELLLLADLEDSRELGTCARNVVRERRASLGKVDLAMLKRDWSTLREKLADEGGRVSELVELEQALLLDSRLLGEVGDDAHKSLVTAFRQQTERAFARRAASLRSFTSFPGVVYDGTLSENDLKLIGRFLNGALRVDGVVVLGSPHELQSLLGRAAEFAVTGDRTELLLRGDRASYLVRHFEGGATPVVVGDVPDDLVSGARLGFLGVAARDEDWDVDARNRLRTDILSWVMTIAGNVPTRDALEERLLAVEMNEWHKSVLELREFGGKKTLPSLQLSVVERHLLDALRLEMSDGSFFTAGGAVREVRLEDLRRAVTESARYHALVEEVTGVVRRRYDEEVTPEDVIAQRVEARSFFLLDELQFSVGRERGWAAGGVEYTSLARRSIAARTRLEKLGLLENPDRGVLQDLPALDRALLAYVRVARQTNPLFDNLDRTLSDSDRNRLLRGYDKSRWPPEESVTHAAASGALVNSVVVRDGESEDDGSIGEPVSVAPLGQPHAESAVDQGSASRPSSEVAVPGTEGAAEGGQGQRGVKGVAGSAWWLASALALLVALALLFRAIH